MKTKNKQDDKEIINTVPGVQTMKKLDCFYKHFSALLKQTGRRSATAAGQRLDFHRVIPNYVKTFTFLQVHREVVEVIQE